MATPRREAGECSRRGAVGGANIVFRAEWTMSLSLRERQTPGLVCVAIYRRCNRAPFVTDIASFTRAPVARATFFYQLTRDYAPRKNPLIPAGSRAAKRHYCAPRTGVNQCPPDRRGPAENQPARINEIINRVRADSAYRRRGKSLAAVWNAFNPSAEWFFDSRRSAR